MKVILAILCLTPLFLSSQAKEVSLHKLDTIFRQWNKTDTPGIAASIVKNGSTFYTKGFGTANLEYGIVITPQTKFQVDDIAKQFTTLALLLLEEQGKIKRWEAVQKYIPELPQYPWPLTVDHVLNHSTGLNDYTTLKALRGDDVKTVFTQEEALQLIAAQNRLNFEPGTDFSFYTADTEATLLAELVSRASGQSFQSFTQEFIFEPLGMKNTLFCEHYETLISNKAASYARDENGIQKSTIGLSTPGPTNLFTTAEDLAIWYAQFHKEPTGLPATIQKLDTPVRLTNGKTYNSSWGRMTLGRDFYHFERGEVCYWMFGLIGGYGANVFRFPNQELTTIALGNNMQYNGVSAMTMAEHFLEDIYPEPPLVDLAGIKVKKLSQRKLRNFEGYYWKGKYGFARKVALKNDTLRLSGVNGNYETPLLPISETKFQLAVESDDKIFVEFGMDNGQKTYQITSGIGDPSGYASYNPIAYTTPQLEDFTGYFSNTDIGTEYRFKVKDGALVAEHYKRGEIPFNTIKEDTFTSNRMGLRSIVFDRDDAGNVNGFSIFTDGITGLKFTKTDKKDDL